MREVEPLPGWIAIAVKSIPAKHPCKKSVVFLLSSLERSPDVGQRAKMSPDVYRDDSSIVLSWSNKGRSVHVRTEGKQISFSRAAKREDVSVWETIDGSLVPTVRDLVEEVVPRGEEL